MSRKFTFFFFFFVDFPCSISMKSYWAGASSWWIQSKKVLGVIGIFHVVWSRGVSLADFSFALWEIRFMTFVWFFFFWRLQIRKKKGIWDNKVRSQRECFLKGTRSLLTARLQNLLISTKFWKNGLTYAIASKDTHTKGNLRDFCLRSAFLLNLLWLTPNNLIFTIPSLAFTILNLDYSRVC